MTHNKFNNELQHFSIRKLTVGAASVLIGVSFLAGAKTSTVHADTVDDGAKQKAVQSDDSADKEVAVQAASQTQNSAAKSAQEGSSQVSNQDAKQNSTAMQTAQTTDKSANANAVSEKQAPMQKQDVNTSNADTLAKVANVSSSPEIRTNVKVQNVQAESPANGGTQAGSTTDPSQVVDHTEHMTDKHGNAYDIIYYKDGHVAIGAQHLNPNDKDNDTNLEGDVTANTMNKGINYVTDDKNWTDANPNRNGIVGTTTVQGKADSTTNVKLTDIPDGWVTVGDDATKIAAGKFNDDQPTMDASFKMDGDTVDPTDVHIIPGITHLGLGQGMNEGDLLPHTTTKHVPAGVQDDNLNQTINRVITINIPATHNANGDVVPASTKTITQTEHWYRTADINDVTGQVTYGEWQKKDGDMPAIGIDDPNHPEFKNIPGYTVNINNIPSSEPTSTDIGSSQSPKATWQDDSHGVNITYTAEKHNIVFILHDDDPNAKDVPNMPASHDYQTNSTTGQNVNTDAVINTGITLPANADLIGFTTDQDSTMHAIASIPTTYIVRSDSPAKIIYHFKHHVDSDQTDQDKNKQGVKQSDYEETVTRTITINQPTGTVDSNGTIETKTTTIPQQVKLTRTFDYDNFLHKAVNWSAWSKGTFEAQNITVPDGYSVTVQDKNGSPVALGDGKTAGTKVIPAAEAADGYVDPGLHADFTVGDGQYTIQYKDDKGSVVGTATITGKVDQTKSIPTKSLAGSQDGAVGATTTVPNSIPAGYTLVSGEKIPASVKLVPKDKDTSPIVINVVANHLGFDKDHPIQPGTTTPTGQQINNGQGVTDLTRDIHRVVNIQNPNYYDDQGNLQKGKLDHHDDDISYTRSGWVDEVTGDVHYNDWTPVNPAKTSFGNITVPQIDGYKASQDVVPSEDMDPTKLTDATAKKNKNDEITNWANNHNTPIDITYTANTVSQTINFVDNAGNVIYAWSHSGNTNTKVDLTKDSYNETTKLPTDPTNALDGWKLSDGQSVPSSIIMRAKDANQKIQVEHIMVTVSHKNPVTTAMTIPGTTTKKYPSGLTQDDLNHTAHREITVNFPASFHIPKEFADKYGINDTNHTITQTINFSRNATVDAVTGIVTYDGNLEGHWSANADDPNADHSGNFQQVTIPRIPGYTLHISIAKASGVNGASNNDPNRMFGDQKVTVSFVRAAAPNTNESTSKNAPIVPSSSAQTGSQNASKSQSGASNSAASKPNDSKTNQGQNRSQTGKIADQSSQSQNGAMSFDNDSKTAETGKTTSQSQDGQAKQDQTKTNDTQQAVVPSTPAIHQVYSANGEPEMTSSNPAIQADIDHTSYEEMTPVASTNAATQNSNAASVQNTGAAIQNSNDASAKNTKSDKSAKTKSVDDTTAISRKAKHSNASRSIASPAKTTSAVSGSNATVPVMQEAVSYEPSADGSGEVVKTIAPMATQTPTSSVAADGSSSQAVLPQTGTSKNAAALAALGIAASGLALFGLAGARKRKEN